MTQPMRSPTAPSVAAAVVLGLEAAHLRAELEDASAGRVVDPDRQRGRGTTPPP